MIRIDFLLSVKVNKLIFWLFKKLKFVKSEYHFIFISLQIFNRRNIRKSFDKVQQPRTN